MTRKPSQEFGALVAKVMDGDASHEERRAFAALLKGDEALRLRYMELMRLHAMLLCRNIASARGANRVPLSMKALRQASGKGFPWPWVAAAAVAIMAIGLTLRLVPSPRATGESPAPSGEGMVGSLECARRSRRFESGSKLPHSIPALIGHPALEPPGQLAELPVVHAPSHDPTDHADNPLAGGRGGARGGFTAEDAEVHGGGGVAKHPLLEPAVSAVAAPLHRDPSDPSNPSNPTDHSRDPHSTAALAAPPTISAAGTEPAALAPEQPAAPAPHKKEEAEMRATQKLAAAVSAAALTGATALQAAVPVVSNVEIEQIQHTRKVRITYDLADADAIVTLAIETNGVAIPEACITWLKGDVNKKVTEGDGKVIEWNAGADWPENICDDTKARVTAWSLDNPPPVVVVDLSAGSTAQAYPVVWYPSTDALPGGVANSIYKDSRLVLKRIKAGYFTMGDGTRSKEVILTDDFYIGIYQLTQGQWSNVMGNWPANFRDVSSRAFHPVEQVSQYDIRENNGVNNTANALYNWPTNGHEVNPDSFMGKLRARTSGALQFDLPTEAQWEYACRAGTTGAYNVDGASMDDLGWYSGNSGSKTHVVGEKLPNAWGLFDMHGNVYEWCLDWNADNLTGGENPVGPVSDSNEKRVYRGGGCYNVAAGCYSTARSSYTPSTRNDAIGLRVAAASMVSCVE